jgi:predicted nucleic acid-binding protein
MSDRFFLDTNILVYALTKSDLSKQAVAVQLITDAIDSGEGLISFQIVQEFFSVAFRRFDPPMSLLESEEFLAMPLRPLLAVHSSHALYPRALHLTHLHSLSWYDSLIVAAALEANCRILYTEDLQHGQIFDTLCVQNPFL